MAETFAGTRDEPKLLPPSLREAHAAYLVGQGIFKVFFAPQGRKATPMWRFGMEDSYETTKLRVRPQTFSRCKKSVLEVL